MIMISTTAYIIPPIIIAILLLMIVYVGIGRASLLINIVRFDLGGRGHEKELVADGQDIATRRYLQFYEIIWFLQQNQAN